MAEKNTSNQNIVIDCSDQLQFDCTNPDCQQWVVNRHEIGIAKLNLMVENFFYTPEFPSPKIFLREYISSVVNSTSCETAVALDPKEADALVSFDELNHSDNFNITFSVPLSKTSSYSIALFLGILSKFPSATEFHFYKAYEINLNTQVITPVAVFQVYDNQTLLYNCDYSGVHP